MRLVSSGVLLAATVACAHAPKQPASGGGNIEVVARGVVYATRVLEPAAAYEIYTPAGVEAKRVLPIVARYTSLVVAGPSLLRRAGDVTPGVVRITVDAIEAVSPTEVVCRFSYASDDLPTTACAVGILVADDPSDTLDFRPIGEEHCWPRPSQKR